MRRSTNMGFLAFSLPLWTALPGCATTSRTDIASAERIDELERENANLREQIETLQEMVAQSIPPFGVACGPRIEATVLDVQHDLRLVVLDKGKKDGVKVGYVFFISPGSTYKGAVRIQDVQEGMSSGLILNEKSLIARGDFATTNM